MRPSLNSVYVALDSFLVIAIRRTQNKFHLSIQVNVFTLQTRLKRGPDSARTTVIPSEWETWLVEEINLLLYINGNK